MLQKQKFQSATKVVVGADAFLSLPDLGVAAAGSLDV